MEGNVDLVGAACAHRKPIEEVVVELLFPSYFSVIKIVYITIQGIQNQQ